MEFPEIRTAPGFRREEADCDTANMSPQPMVIEGVIHVPAGVLQLAGLHHPDGGAFVAIAMSRGPAGLIHQVTPAYARELAERLIGIADRAEKHLADVAAAKLEATLAKRGKP